MKNLLQILCLFLITINCDAQDTLKLSDFKSLNNTYWEGVKLTYKDYQSGKLTGIDATMQIYIEEEKIITNIQYTYEPNKNNKSTVKINKSGTHFGNEKVLSNTIENGVRTFITLYDGKDNGKDATMYIIHQFSEDFYTVTKEVQLNGTEERFVRNHYEFNKIN